MTTPKKLTAMQKLFVAAYAKSLNYTEAYIEAGGSKKTANSAGPRLGQQPHIKAAIDLALAKHVAKFEKTADDVLLEVARVAFLDLRQAYDANGHLKPVQDLPDDVARAIAGIKVFDEFEGQGEERVQVGEVREVKFVDKMRALELLGKYLKLWTDKTEHSVPPQKDPRDGMTGDELKALARAQLRLEAEKASKSDSADRVSTHVEAKADRASEARDRAEAERRGA